MEHICNVDNNKIILGALELTAYFDVIAHTNQVPHRKPHPEIYKIAIDQLDLSSAEIIAFEEPLGGGKCAQHLGYSHW